MKGTQKRKLVNDAEQSDIEKPEIEDGNTVPREISPSRSITTLYVLNEDMRAFVE